MNTPANTNIHTVKLIQADDPDQNILHLRTTNDPDWLTLSDNTSDNVLALDRIQIACLHRTLAAWLANNIVNM